MRPVPHARALIRLQKRPAPSRLSTTTPSPSQLGLRRPHRPHKNRVNSTRSVLQRNLRRRAPGKLGPSAKLCAHSFASVTFSRHPRILRERVHWRGSRGASDGEQTAGVPLHYLLYSMVAVPPLATAPLPTPVTRPGTTRPGTTGLLICQFV
jgi:hypothetical protein